MKKIFYSIALFSLMSLAASAQGQGSGGSLNASSQWRTNGNSAQSTDFIGTTNNSDLIFKTNNIVQGRVDALGICDGAMVVKESSSIHLIRWPILCLR